MEEWQDIEETVKSTRLHQSTRPNMKVNQDSYDEQAQCTRSLKTLLKFLLHKMRKRKS